MIVKQKNQDQIVVAFSSRVGSDGLKRIKSFIELLENRQQLPKKKVTQSQIKKLSDEISSAAWEKFKKAKGL